MDASTIIAALQEGLPGAQIEAAPSVDLQPTIMVAAGDLPAVARALREHPALQFDFLAELTATTRSEAISGITVMRIALTHRVPTGAIKSAA